MLVRHGVAVLVYDKRGIGQSDGRYPGESPTADTIDTLARDAQAAARFLAAQPEIDPKRVGLTGHSQAGWIAPLAASREPAIRFLLVFSGPAVTADENDLFQDLAGQGDRTATLTDAEIDAQVLKAGPGGVDPIPVDPQAEDPVALAVRRARPHRPAGALGATARPDRCRAREGHHGRRLPEREPCARRDEDRPDVGDAPLRHVRARACSPAWGSG